MSFAELVRFSAFFAPLSSTFGQVIIVRFATFIFNDTKLKIVLCVFRHQIKEALDAKLEKNYSPDVWLHSYRL